MTAAAMLAAVGAGAILGLRHATDTDHIVAVTTLVQREPRLRAAVRTAVAWGLGHSLSFLALGAAVILLDVRPPPPIATAVDLLVAAMLIGLGLWHLRGWGTSPAPAETTTRRRSFAVGLVHGLAGSGAIALVALTTIESRAGAVVYLGAFAAGSLAGMALFTVIISMPLRWSARRLASGRALTVVSAVASVVVGVTIAAGSAG